MAIAVLHQIKQALSTLNPHELREQAERPVRVGLMAASSEELGEMEQFFAPPLFSPERRAQAARLLVRGGGPGCDVQIYHTSLLRPAKTFSFDPDAPEDCVKAILRAREDLHIPLARQLAPFRRPVTGKIIRSIAKENALFCWLPRFQMSCPAWRSSRGL